MRFCQLESGGSLDEGAEEGDGVGAFGGAFGVPLDGEAEAAVGGFDGFDGAVGGVGGDAERGGHGGDGLVVVAADDVGAGASDGGESGIVFDRDGFFCAGGVGVVTDDFGQVLVEGAAFEDVEELATVANAEDGEIGAQEGGETLFKLGADGVFEFGFGVRGLAVEGGIEVAAADDEPAVEEGGVGFGGDGWAEDDGGSASGVDALDVIVEDGDPKAGFGSRGEFDGDGCNRGNDADDGAGVHFTRSWMFSTFRLMALRNSAPPTPLMRRWSRVMPMLA